MARQANKTPPTKAAAKKSPAKKTASQKAARKPAAAAAKLAADPLWLWRLLLLIAAVAALREIWNALALVPAHFDESQYWAYGEAFDFGYYSKPPLAAWAIRAATWAFGDTLFGLRFFAPVCHLWIGWMIYAAAARLYDRRTGFWAAAGYTLAPGVAVSAGLMTTDPVMMAGWALALYALVRAMEGDRVWWWILVGAGVGLGMLAKYTAIAFAGGGLGYALFSREGEWRWRGAIFATVSGLIVLSPNIVWNAAHGFATFGHLEENAGGAGGGLHPGEMAEFFGSQFAVIGPIFFGAILAALAGLGWRGDWRDRLLVWMTAPLLVVMLVQALRAHANPNWTAPAFIAGSIIAARWLLGRNLTGWLKAHLWIGAASMAAIWIAGAVYAEWGTDLPRRYDPFKKMRVGGPFCERALTAMEAEGIDVLLSDSRARLSDCLWEGSLRMRNIAVFDPDGVANNQYELTSRLEPGDRRPMILAVMDPNKAALIAAQFTVAEELETGRFRTHGDRTVPFSVWRVEGFHGY